MSVDSQFLKRINDAYFCAYFKGISCGDFKKEK